MKSLIISVFIAALLFPSVLEAQVSRIHLYRDENRCLGYHLPTEPYASFECWVWIEPGTGGVDCADFRIDLPSNAVVTGIHHNPDLGTPPDPLTPWTSPGTSWCFSPCQTDWFWIYRLDIMVLDLAVSYITIAPYELSGIVGSRSCSGDPEELYPGVEFCINEYSGPITPVYPRIQTVHLATYTMLVAEFDYPLIDPVSAADFWLQELESPEGTIAAVSAVMLPNSDSKVIINFASPMEHGRSYFLNASDFCNACECGPSWKVFYFNEGISTEESTWGAVKLLNKD